MYLTKGPVDLSHFHICLSDCSTVSLSLHNAGPGLQGTKRKKEDKEKTSKVNHRDSMADVFVVVCCWFTQNKDAEIESV